MKLFKLFSTGDNSPAGIPSLLSVVKPKVRFKTFQTLPDEELRQITDRMNSRCPFYRCVGQDVVIEQLLALLVERLRSEQHSSKSGGGAIMFTGPASTGKTTFASLVFGKTGLDLPYIQTDAKKVKGAETILTLMQAGCQEAGFAMQSSGTDAGRAKYTAPPLGFLIDEIHGLTTGVMDDLLKALESNECQLITSDAVVDCRNVTWIGATTQRGEIIRKNSPFDSRFEKIEFHSYTIAEVTTMMQLTFGWPRPACESLAIRAGCIVREAIAIGNKVGRQLSLMRLRNDTAGIMDAIAVVGKQMGIDDDGMSDKQLTVLQALARRAPKGMSYPQLARVINRSVRELQEVVLPALQLETVEQAPRITWSGFTHITEAGMAELRKRNLITDDDVEAFKGAA